MSTKEKLIMRFLAFPKDFTYNEVVRLFKIFGYVERTKGSTSGSRVEFVSKDGLRSYIMHKPYPSNIIKRYVLKQMYSFFEEQNHIKIDKRSKQKKAK